MKLLVFGSLNIDIVMQVDHFVCAGETLQATQVQIYPGGKGLNQAIAIARAGSDVYMAGAVGADGQQLLDLLDENGVDRSLVRRTDGLSGSATIQLIPSGQNCILIAANANGSQSTEYIDEVLGHFSAGDIILVQNEINLLDEIISRAHEKQLRVYLNPSPFNDALKQCRLEWVSGFLLNEIEGAQMTGENEPERILQALHRLYPQADIVLTLGADGVLFINAEEQIAQKAFQGKAIDTTAAGDSFTGYYLACLHAGADQKTALRLASKAAAIAVTLPGATSSIPRMERVLNASIVEYA